MRRSRSWAPIALLVALPMSQLGHWLAYLLRFGPEAGIRQATGTHAYFPGLLQTSIAALAGILLAALLLVALARFMVGVRNERVPEGGWPLLPLLLVLLAAQLAAFAGQELLEAWLHRAAAPSPAALAGWGLAGQLPVAIPAALGLSWIAARVRSALGRIVHSRRLIVLPRPAPGPLPGWLPVGGNLLRSSGIAVFFRRGPPTFSRS